MYICIYIYIYREERERERERARARARERARKGERERGRERGRAGGWEGGRGGEYLYMCVYSPVVEESVALENVRKVGSRVVAEAHLLEDKHTMSTLFK